MTNATKAALEASLKKAAFEKAAGQNYDQRSDGGLRDQPHDFFTIIQRYL
mgnify:CR=1 FL=1